MFMLPQSSPDYEDEFEDGGNKGGLTQVFHRFIGG